MKKLFVATFVSFIAVSCSDNTPIGELYYNTKEGPAAEEVSDYRSYYGEIHCDTPDGRTIITTSDYVLILYPDN